MLIKDSHRNNMPYMAIFWLAKNGIVTNVHQCGEDHTRSVKVSTGEGKKLAEKYLPKRTLDKIVKSGENLSVTTLCPQTIRE